MPDIVFTIKENRIKQSAVEGFSKSGRALKLNAQTYRGSAFLAPLDSGTVGMEWGRFHASIEADERRAYFLYAYATENKQLASEDRLLDLEKYFLSPEVAQERKLDLMERLSARRFSQKDDVLLYGLEGRYLFLAISVIGEGDFFITDMKLDSEGDVFLDLFPEVYKNRGDFFHRFLSIFASCYHDIREEIDDLPKLLDPDTTPVEMLSVYGSWMGIDIPDGVFPEKVMRGLIKEAWQLNRMKGSRRAIQRLLKIILDEDAIILEQNHVSYYNRLNGASYAKYSPEDRYEIVILVKSEISADMHAQIFHLLNQFCPIRTRIKVVQLSNNGILDANSYLDMNAALFEGQGAAVDSGELDGGMILLE